MDEGSAGGGEGRFAGAFDVEHVRQEVRAFLEQRVHYAGKLVASRLLRQLQSVYVLLRRPFLIKGREFNIVFGRVFCVLKQSVAVEEKLWLPSAISLLFALVNDSLEFSGSYYTIHSIGNLERLSDFASEVRIGCISFHRPLKFFPKPSLEPFQILAKGRASQHHVPVVSPVASPWHELVL